MKKLLLYGILGVFLVGAAFIGFETRTIAPPPSATAPAQSALKTDAETQQKRERLIRKTMEQGIFYKTEITGTLPKLWVAPRFYALDFDDKQKFVSVVAAYYMGQSPQWKILVLKDSKTGKRIGQFDERGLRLE